jgi:hypothetical protein
LVLRHEDWHPEHDGLVCHPDLPNLSFGRCRRQIVLLGIISRLFAAGKSQDTNQEKKTGTFDSVHN